ncbi:MAG TPA: DUF2231 domain-containing protein [Longimicrobiaceae bacterium]|jgi:uncharacterized membrane protein|nr:DUF2231 domain-containing protein [Longimicrobiaceae bacterium]
MAMRLQELHPSLVHFPIALLPTTIVADMVGRMRGDPVLLEIGRRGIKLVAASAVLTGLTGVIAQEEVRATGKAHDLLVTHRTLNVALTLTAIMMARHRARRRRPSLRYLLLGMAGAGVMSYSAYLGGKMVYEHGVGVVAAGGTEPGLPPEVRPDNLAEVAQHSAGDIGRGLRHAAEDMMHGDVVPALTGG